jgi:hypothetical protein
MLTPIGYVPFLLKKNKLHPLKSSMEENAVSFNYYFIPTNKQENLRHLIQN